MRTTTETTQSRFWIESTRRMSWQRFSSTGEVEYPQHVHSEFNLVVCLAGRVEVRQFGHVETLEPGQVLVGNATVPHQSTYRAENGVCRAISLTVSDDLFCEAAEREARWRATEKDRLLACSGKLTTPRIYSIARAVDAELRDAARPSDQLLETLGRFLLGEALAKWPIKNRAQERTGDRTLRLPRWQFVRAHERMLRVPKDSFSVTGMARDLGISTSRFHDLFRAAAGLPPAKYYKNLLLQLAAERLVSANDQIKEIGYDIGFRTPSHFCSVFRRHYGLSPLEYREHFFSGQRAERPEPSA